MKWFKHMTDALDDPFIQELLSKFGSNGYLAWFGLIEIISKENKNDITGKLDISSTFLKQKLHISSGKLQEIFTFCSGKGKLFFNFSENNFNFHLPKIQEIKDNYTKDLQGACQKPSHHKEEEVEVDKKKNKDKDNIITLSSNGNVKSFLEYTSKTFKDSFKENLLIEYGKDGAIVKGLLKTYDLPKLQGLWDAFLASNDDFIKKTGYSIGVFKTQINKLLTTKKGGSNGTDRKEDEYSTIGRTIES